MLQNPPGFQIDFGLLREFELGLDPLSPGRSKIPARILGYGEISTVLEIQVEQLRGLAFKRLSIFQSLPEMERYRAAYVEYNRLFEDEIGIRIPANGYAAILNDTGRPIFYIIQKLLPSSWIGNEALHVLPGQGVRILVQRILQELQKIWGFNHRQSRVQVSIDGQLSNWAIEGFDPGQPVLDERLSLFYMDTSTPLFQIEGVGQLDPELFLRNAPSFLVGLVRLLFLKDVLTRYYDFHLVAVDLVANFYKEQRPDLIPELVRVVNDFFAGEAADLGVKPIGEREVRDYYREDAFIWSFYLSMRKLDRFVQTRLLRREYPYMLPGRIKR